MSLSGAAAGALCRLTLAPRCSSIRTSNRLVPSRGGRSQQRLAVLLCAARVDAAALVQPPSPGMERARVHRMNESRASGSA